MDFKKMLSTMTQLNEAKEQVKPGITKVTGSYGKEYDAGDDGTKKKPASDVKKGRGRPKKDADETGEVKTYDTSTLGNVFGGGKKPLKPIGKVSKKNTLKDWFEQLDKAIVNEGPLDTMRAGMQGTGPASSGGLSSIRSSMQQRGAGAPSVQRTNQSAMGRVGQMANRPVEEADQIEIKPASQVPQKPGQPSTGAAPAGSGQPQQVAGQQQNTQVIQQGDKTLGTVNNPALAQQIKQSIGKGEMTLNPDMAEDAEMGVEEGDVGKHNNATTGFDALVRKLTPKYGVEAAKRIAGSQLKKIKEADMPPHDGNQGAGLGAGRNQTTLESRAKADNKAEKAGKKVTKDIEYDEKKKVKEAKKPDANKNGIPDYAEDGKGKNDLKKKKVKEGMDHRLKAAHHAGKSHALSKQGYNCAYDDMEESRCYHEGYKEGLDECYGQMPIQGYVGETGVESTVDDMASFGAHTPRVADEGNAFTKKLATTPAGGSFSLGGKSFRDTSAYDSSVFESWDNELNSLLEEYDSITEGITVSSSQGQSNQPDSVSVTASDSDAQALMAVLRSAGIGGFGGGDTHGQPDAMTVDTGEPEEIGTGGAEIDVVDDHGNMMDLIRKVTGGAPKGPEHGFGDSHDEEGEEHDHGEEEVCDACGSATCECDESSEEQQVDEVESEDQMEYEVAEDNAPDSGAEETAQEDNDDQNANASAASYDKATEEEDDLEESYANSADDTFEADISYMTKIISGGLNKEKSTGQTTVPVIANQKMRTGVAESRQLNESVVNDWKKLAGIK